MSFYFSAFSTYLAEDRGAVADIDPVFDGIRDERGCCYNKFNGSFMCILHGMYGFLATMQMSGAHSSTVK